MSIFDTITTLEYTSPPGGDLLLLHSKLVRRFGAHNEWNKELMQKPDGFFCRVIRKPDTTVFGIRMRRTGQGLSTKTFRCMGSKQMRPWNGRGRLEQY